MNTFKTKLIGMVLVLVLVGTLASVTYTARAQPFVKVAETRDSMHPSDVDWFTVTLEGGVTYSFDLIVRWGSDFDIKVYDENGNLVGSGTNGRGEDEEVFVTPSWTGTFEVKVYYYAGTSTNYDLQLWREL
ncbi:hypothetical protein KGY77_11185 [Candidatus Bipolaricaulota bacterium]|nr:hypothetical protein [Candidatus Bipolaricaulota bacterium]MBS3793191.1 hypothetical protein [Candidatus Bipolaricaulota bacterium]